MKTNISKVSFDTLIFIRIFECEVTFYLEENRMKEKNNRQKWKRVLLAGMTAWSIISGCGILGVEEEQKTHNSLGNEESSMEIITFQDDLGREVKVRSAKRVVCLTSSFADIWHLAGGVEQIVATTDATWKYFDLPLKEDTVNLGSSKELNLEQLIACEPDLVLASCGTDRNVELESILTDMGITTAYFSVDNIDDYLRMLDICTQITGKVENYTTYGTDVKREVELAIERADDTQPSVLYIRATGSSCKVKNSRGSVLGEMLEELGCENIADRENRLLEQLSLEVIIEEDPQYIFVILQGTDSSAAEEILENTLLKNPAWAELTAVQEGRYYVLDSNLYNMKPNARWGEAYEKLADILYPEK